MADLPLGLPPVLYHRQVEAESKMTPDRTTSTSMSNSGGGTFSDAPHDEQFFTRGVSPASFSFSSGNDASMADYRPEHILSMLIQDSDGEEERYSSRPVSQVSAPMSTTASSASNSGITVSTGYSSTQLTWIDGEISNIPAAQGDATSKLQMWYDKLGSFHQLKKNFCSWPKGPQNAQTWTAAFVCPISGECFVAGTLLHVQTVEPGAPGIAWYADKRLAKKAAAGWAMDCFRYRENATSSDIVHFCRERPVPEATGAHLLMHVPSHIPQEHQLEIKQIQMKRLAE